MMCDFRADAVLAQRSQEARLKVCPYGHHRSIYSRISNAYFQNQGDQMQFKINLDRSFFQEVNLSNRFIWISEGLHHFLSRVRSIEKQWY